MSDSYAIRDEYVSGKRQELTLWSGPFASTYEGFARELPNHAGFMVRRYWHEDEPIRVACPAPRDEHNYQTVDAAINAALSREIGETK